MWTLLAECEMLVNTRPLTNVNPSVESLALKTTHFLFGSCGEAKPLGDMTDDPDVLQEEMEATITRGWAVLAKIRGREFVYLLTSIY